jgi:hypothetical protein
MRRPRRFRRQTLDLLSGVSGVATIGTKTVRPSAHHDALPQKRQIAQIDQRVADDQQGALGKRAVLSPPICRRARTGSMPKPPMGPNTKRPGAPLAPGRPMGRQMEARSGRQQRLDLAGQ